MIIMYIAEKDVKVICALDEKEMSVLNEALFLIECTGCPFETDEKECNENTMCEKILQVIGKQKLTDEQREVVARQLMYFETNNCFDCPVKSECKKWEGQPICVAISEKAAHYSWNKECFYPFEIELNCNDCKLALDGLCDTECTYRTDGYKWIPDYEGAVKYVEDSYV
jgi:hypothetical protein